MEARKLYVEEGADVAASGAVVGVWCVIDGDTHEQVGEAFSSPEDAGAAIALARLIAG